MVPKFAPAWVPNCAGDSAGCCWVGGEPVAQLGMCPSANINMSASTNRAPLIPSPELLWPQRAAELRSAWAGEGARPHTSKFRNSGWSTMKPFGFDESLKGTRCSQEQSLTTGTTGHSVFRRSRSMEWKVPATEARNSPEVMTSCRNLRRSSWRISPKVTLKASCWKILHRHREYALEATH